MVARPAADSERSQPTIPGRTGWRPSIAGTGSLSYVVGSDTVRFEMATVNGPLLATHTLADRAVGWWYPTASMLSHSDSESATDLTYRWGGMGHDGYQQDDVVSIRSAGICSGSP